MPAAGGGGTVALGTVFLHVTKACDLRCAYCYFSAARPLPDEMTAGELARVWPDLVALRPRKVVFTGGEPLLRPDLLDLLRGLRDADPAHAVLRGVNSNGRLVTERYALDLIGLADEVRVSVDALEERNDRLRGPGTFRAALRALETFRDVGFEPKALVTVTTESLPDLEDLLVLLRERGIARVNLNLHRPLGRGADRPDRTVRPDELDRVVRRAASRLRGAPAPEGFGSRGDDPEGRCGVGHFLNVLPNGDVFPCHVLTRPEFRLGNLRARGLREICAANGFLGDLAAVAPASLRSGDARLDALVRRLPCLGEARRRLPSSPGWAAMLPSLGDAPATGLPSPPPVAPAAAR